MKKQRAYKFRLYPDRQQEVLFHKTFGCCRFLYNRMLADKKEMYEKTGKTERLTPAGYKKEYPWLKEVDSLALANVSFSGKRKRGSQSSNPDTGAGRATQRMQ